MKNPMPALVLKTQATIKKNSTPLLVAGTVVAAFGMTYMAGKSRGAITIDLVLVQEQTGEVTREALGTIPR